VLPFYGVLGSCLWQETVNYKHWLIQRNSFPEQLKMSSLICTETLDGISVSQEQCGGLCCGFVFLYYRDVYCCSHTNDAEQFFEKMEQKDADTYSALMVGLYKVCVT